MRHTRNAAAGTETVLAFLETVPDSCRPTLDFGFEIPIEKAILLLLTVDLVNAGCFCDSRESKTSPLAAFPAVEI